MLGFEVNPDGVDGLPKLGVFPKPELPKPDVVELVSPVKITLLDWIPEYSHKYC